MSTTEVKDQIDARTREARDAAERAEQAAALDAKRTDLRGDIARLERRRDAFAALGDGRVEIPQRLYVHRYHQELELEPLRSKKSGTELAEGVEANIAHLQIELAKTERDIKQLLA